METAKNKKSQTHNQFIIAQEGFVIYTKGLITRCQINKIWLYMIDNE